LQQQNAWRQQLNAVQMAVRLTTALLQAANQQNGLTGQVAVPNPINFQQ
jgi:hypothetical protein